MITDIVVGVMAFLGTVFVFLAAVGLIRMPDTYLRLAVTTKAATLGVGLLLIAGAIHAYDLASTAKVLAIILFVLLTAPISAHLIGRTSYFAGVKLWKGSVMDELKGQYDPNTQKLSSGSEEVETKTPAAKD
ncbi:monovalent cation/H(+) antiporter subunit G [Antarcticibacterium sp. 1MA-6-2]|uniref:monovalent cation/H(+) antiporter subunit G n=1 Tax=Antarcticibacterium sp. 1MA-6-2 TaxID=2908210 RepID=UPI001F437896|nr:monovalent cation/H(+) antiporter subunit G [Antarcticibacterium sp. 1MA-6-2]UJH89954.1 monovalent cation/H(+) antiporter subunit G [Antarcticibacterium sp. 1MA-6-2]